MNQIKYKTEKFDLLNDDILWEKFMCFARMIIPYEEHWEELTEYQKGPLIAFVYESDVLGEGHIGFIEINSDYMSLNDVIKALKRLHISSKYIENIEKVPQEYLSVDELLEQSKDEEDFSAKMDEMDAIFEPYDKVFYELVSENTEIEDKILEYIRGNYEEFFEMI